MGKYIDADKLKAILGRRKKLAQRMGKAIPSFATNPVIEFAISEYNKLIGIISSLQKKQPKVDLETEIEEYINNFFYTEPSTADFPPEDIAYTMWKEDIRIFARHFYELGQKEMRERIANPQYNQEVIAKMKSEYPTEEFKARKEE